MKTPETEDTVNRFNALLGIVASVVACVLPFAAKFPTSTLPPMLGGAVVLIGIPLIMPRCTRAIEGRGGETVRYIQRAFWMTTMFFMAGLATAAFLWLSLPAAIANGMGVGASPVDVNLLADLQTTEHSLSRYRLHNPSAAYSEWSDLMGNTHAPADFISIVGVLVNCPLDSKQESRITLRALPAKEFFSEKRGPIPVFHTILSGWLVVVVLLELFFVFVLPFFADIARGLQSS